MDTSCLTVVIEDSLVTQKWLKNVIDSPRVEYFTRYKPAYEFLATAEPAVVFLDLNLPDSEPSTTIASVKKIRNRGHSVLVFTGSTDEPTIQACIEAGAAGVICKDSLMDTLKAQWMAATKDTVRMVESRHTLKKLHEVACEGSSDDSRTLGDSKWDRVSNFRDIPEYHGVSEMVSSQR